MRLAALPTYADLVEAAKEARQAGERAGCAVSLPDGRAVQVDTERDDLMPLLALLTLPASWPQQWKGGGVFYEIDQADAQALYAAAQTHASNLYAAEAQALASIDAGSITTRAQITAKFEEI